MQNNGVATTYIQINEDHEDNTPLFEFKYTHNESKKEIYMQLERVFISKNGLSLGSSNSNEKWNTFNETISVIEENYKEDNFVKTQKEYYDRHPYNYNSFDDYLTELKMNYNVETLDELIDSMKNQEIKLITKIFEAQITFRYEINAGKMTLTEEFTGIHNTLDSLLGSSCDYEGDDISLWITYDYASLNLRNQIDSPYYIGSFFSSSANEIIFINENDKTDTITATYEEDIKNETITVTIKDKEFTCNFHGNKYIQQ